MKSLYKNVILNRVLFILLICNIIVAMVDPKLITIFPINVFFILTTLLLCNLIFYSLLVQMKFTRNYRKNKQNIKERLSESETITIKELSRLLKMTPFEVYIAMPHCFHKPPSYLGQNGKFYEYLYELKKDTQLVKIMYKTNIPEAYL